MMKLVFVVLLAALGSFGEASPDEAAIARFQEYLRIRSDQPNPDYTTAVQWLEGECKRLQLKPTIIKFKEAKPLIYCTLQGKDTSLPSLMLNSHMDVVPPGDATKWESPAFEAKISDDGFIVARGSQDMKSVGMQYLLAIERLLGEKWAPDRTIHISFVPEEEVGGMDGMMNFVKSDHFKALNVGALMDEGLPSQGKAFSLFYGERQTWKLIIRSVGAPGHGATLPETTAVNNLMNAMSKALAYREKEFKRVQSGEAKRGDVLGINIVALEAGLPNGIGGYVNNVIPAAAEAYIDVRVPPQLTEDQVNGIVASWLECPDGHQCPGLSHRYTLRAMITEVTSLDPNKSQWIARLKGAANDLGLEFIEELFPAATDARFLREAGIPAFGFSPINGSEDLLHKDNEKLSIEVFIRGIGIYEKLISSMSSSGDEVANDEL